MDDDTSITTSHLFMEIFQAFVLDGTTHTVNVRWDADRPLFRASEIASVIGISCIHSSVSTFDEDERVSLTTQSLGGDQVTIFLTEAGVYRLLMLSRKPIARPFQKWVTKLLVTIRETGRYELGAKLTQMEELAKAESERTEARISDMMRDAAQQTKLGIERALHFSLIDLFKGPGRNVIYFGKIRDMDDGTMLIKVGSTESIKDRCASLERDYGSITFFRVIDSGMFRDFEKYIQKHPKALPFVYSGVIHQSKCSNGEVVLMRSENVTALLLVAARNAWKFKSHAELARLCNERAHERTELVRAQIELARTSMTTDEHGPELVEEQSEDENEDDDEDDNYNLHIIADEHGYTQSRGTKIQRYSPDGLMLIHTYEGLAVAMRDPQIPNISRPQVKISIANRHVYRGFRWASLPRDQSDDTMQDIGPTESSVTPPNKAMVAMLDLDRARVVNVFCDGKAASEGRKFKNGSAISKALRLGTQSGGHYFMTWEAVPDALKQMYLSIAQLPPKRSPATARHVEQLHPITSRVIKTHASMESVITDVRMSRTSLNHALASGAVCKGYRWRSLVCL